MSDPGVTYRKKTEIDEYRKTKDCILLIKQLIIDNKVATEDDLKDIERSIKKEVDETVEKARADPYPDAKDLLKDVYIEENNDKRKRYEVLRVNLIFRTHQRCWIRQVLLPWRFRIINFFAIRNFIYKSIKNTGSVQIEKDL